MVITVKGSYRFSLQVLAQVTNSLLTSQGIANGQTTVVSAVHVSVNPSQASWTVPDWVAIDPLFVLAVAGGTATVAQAPTNQAVLNITTGTGTAALPLAGSPANAYVVCTPGALVALGTSNPAPYGGPNGVWCAPGNVTKLPVGSNSFLGVVLGSGAQIGSVQIVCGA